MINNDNNSFSSEEDSYDENDENSYENSSETDDEVNDLNDLIPDESSESSEDSDLETTLKTTMVFPKKGQSVTKIQSTIQIPQLKGIVLPKQKETIILPKKIIKKYDNEEIEKILSQMPGINISNNNNINYERENIYDYLQKEAQESDKDFSVRKDITLKIRDTKSLEIKNSTCVVIGLMIAKKLRFGIKYDEHIEVLIKDILSMLTK